MESCVISCQSAEEVEAAINQDDVVILLFAEWCPPCQRFKPTFHSASLQANIQFYAVDYVQVPSLKEIIEGLKTFPTVYRYSKGVLQSKYEGTRTIEDLLAWCA